MAADDETESPHVCLERGGRFLLLLLRIDQLRLLGLV